MSDLTHNALVEAMARAIIESQCGAAPQSVRDQCKMPHCECRRSARAALAAIRDAAGLTRGNLIVAADEAMDPEVGRLLHALAGGSDAG